MRKPDIVKQKLYTLLMSFEPATLQGSDGTTRTVSSKVDFFMARIA
jgi:hypothetical protein